MYMFSRKQLQQPAGASGRRAYAVGDIHGRLDLLDGLLDKIHADMEARGEVETLLVFVGDLIDRGPSSSQVIERLRTYSRDGVRPVFLLGNHEEVLLRVLGGDADLIADWLRFGGKQCLLSYGLDPAELRTLRQEGALDAIREAIPVAHVDFLKSFADTCQFGDYLFVHAGIRPGVPLDEQLQADLRWIRDPFLFDDSDHGFVVVHGHTITPEVEDLPNRIGIDTGAYRTGVLTAVAIDGSEHWFLNTRHRASAAVSATH
jgi:serine/threonine protein phosphatase 1